MRRPMSYPQISFLCRPGDGQINHIRAGVFSGQPFALDCIPVFPTIFFFSSVEIQAIHILFFQLGSAIVREAQVN